MRDSFIRPAPSSGFRDEIEGLKARIQMLERNQEIQAKACVEIAEKYESLRQLVYKILLYKAMDAQR